MRKKLRKATALLALLGCLLPASIAEARLVELTSVKDEGHDHSSVYDEIDGYLNKMGYLNSQIIKTTNLTPDSFMTRLPNREIVVTRSHGNRFLDNAGNSIGNYIVFNNGNVYNSDIENLDAGELSGVKLVAFVGCYTAAGGVSSTNTRNLVVASTEKGAKTAVGFSETIYCNTANTWTEFFFKYLSEGKNIDEATNNAVTKAENKHPFLKEGIDSMLYRGAWYYTFVD
ncbi:MAG: C25 family cysteine peptidase [Lachnospiraceae bacterium]|nr:C25 family cysteine peptidase [Lachnospiraceae bacterium]